MTVFDSPGNLGGRLDNPLLPQSSGGGTPPPGGGLQGGGRGPIPPIPPNAPGWNPWRTPTPPPPPMPPYPMPHPNPMARPPDGSIVETVVGQLPAMHGAGTTPYNPDYPTGGGNFRPDIKIDTSRASVAPPSQPLPFQIAPGWHVETNPTTGTGGGSGPAGAQRILAPPGSTELHILGARLLKEDAALARAAAQRRRTGQPPPETAQAARQTAHAAYADDVNRRLAQELARVVPPGFRVEWETTRG